MGGEKLPKTIETGEIYREGTSANLDIFLKLEMNCIR